MFEAEQPKRNELFLPHRKYEFEYFLILNSRKFRFFLKDNFSKQNNNKGMAYIVELNEEETDVPITSIRSKADCPTNENNATLTTNDIVINKLTQILSYLRSEKI